jgi:hypothetical protein
MFKPVRSPDRGRWSVEVHWPDGTAEHIDEFKSDYEACDWISNRSAKWVRDNPQRR